MSFVNHNGNILAAETGLVSAANRGLRYGDGLFETMKMLNGKIIHEAEHLERLWHGMNVLQFETGGHFTKQLLTDCIKALAQKNGHEKAARIRLNIFRGEGGLYDAVNHNPNYIIETWPLQITDTLNSNGFVIGVYDQVKKSCDILSNLKHNNYLPYIMAALHAKQQKWNDALVFNQYGRIADSTISNIFLIKNEVIYTPVLSEGCVAGIMRKALIDYLKKSNWQVNETAVTVEDVLDADEIFLTNSISCMRWVQAVADKKYSNMRTQKIYSGFYPTIC